MIALTRAVSPSLAECELTWVPRVSIDIRKAEEQHTAYEKCLEEMGLRVISLPAEPDMPDSVFVEDPVVVVDEVAIMTRMGAEVRRRESASLAHAISAFRPLKWMKEPATLEGGDVMRIGRDVFVGVSSRSNEIGIKQLADELEPLGYQVHPVKVHGCLHLKSACCSLGEGRILANCDWLDVGPFGDFRMIGVSQNEPNSANVLRIGDTVLMPAAFPETARIVRAQGLEVLTVDISELMKAEAAITCSSVIFDLPES